MIVEALMSLWMLILPTVVSLWTVIVLGPGRELAVAGLCYAGGGAVGALLSRAFRALRKRK